MRRIIIFCLAIGTMEACSGSKGVAQVEQEISAPEAPATPEAPAASNVTPATNDMKDAPLNAEETPAWVFTIERTPCFGRCPWDSFTVRADGTIFYEGKRDVERIGTYTGLVDTDLAAELRKQLDEIGYFDWDAKYDSNISDLPGINLRYMAKDGFAKSVSIRGEAPTGTEHLNNVMLGLYESVKNWDKVDDPEVPHNE